MYKVVKIPSAEPGENGEPRILEVPLKATANIPRMYRIWFRRDIIKDMQELKKAAEKAEKNGEEYSIENLSIFENVAYCMARLADPDNTPHTMDEWLDQFSTFSIYEVLPQILELWEVNLETYSESKKKPKQ